MGMPSDLGREIISDDAFGRISATLPADAELSRNMVEAAACAYLELKKKDEAGTGRGLKADLRALQSKIDAAANAVENISLAMIATIGVAWRIREYPQDDRPARRIGQLAKDLRWMATAIENALSNVNKPYVSRTPVGLELAVSILSTAYRRATGKQITHSAHKDGDYQGGALSPFGSFLLAFFSEVDPKVSSTKIGNVIRKNLASLREPLAD